MTSVSWRKLFLIINYIRFLIDNLEMNNIEQPDDRQPNFQNMLYLIKKME